MKLILIILVLIVVQSTLCRQITKPKRSIHVFDIISNKTSQFKKFVENTHKQVKDTIQTAKDVVTDIHLKVKDTIQTAKDAVTDLNLKVKDTIQTAKNAITDVNLKIKGTIQSTKNAVINVVNRSQKSLSHFTDDKLKTMNDKLHQYIEKVQGTANTIFDAIAPEQVDYECLEKDTAKDMTAMQLITVHGYHAEAHTVITDDGYILTLHRIPYSKNSNNPPTRTVLLHHGFLGCSIDWVIPGPGRSLPYLLSDAGYDVWLANARGNTYSRAHIVKNVDSAAFWNFTFQEIAQYDLPAVIDYIQEHKTGKEKIDYIGYSMGTTALFAMLSTKTEYNQVLRAGYTLAPVAYMSGIKTPFKILAKFGKTIDTFFKLVGANEFLPRDALVRYLSSHSCKVEDIQGAVCEMSMFLLCGHDKNHYDRSLTPLILGHVPAGASTKTLAHFAQEIRSNGKFQKFDYGEEGNMREYGTSTPPEYSLNKITLPIKMISAGGDWLSSVSDAAVISQRLGNSVEHYIVPDSEFNHLDFLFAKDARTLVYDKLMSMMDNEIDQPVFKTNQIA